MTYPCGIIRDLLPLYIDDVCNEESKQAVHNHLSECEKCRSCYESMKSNEGFEDKRSNNSEDSKMASSLKNVKNTINKRIRNIALCAVAAVLVVIVGFNLLFNAVIKNVSLEDITVSANVYSLAELIESPTVEVPDSESVTIFSDENDTSKEIQVKIPELGTITLTEDTIEKCQYATVISVGSEYFLRTIEREVKDNTIYITAFKTTLLNNKALDYQKQIYSLELQEINKIVFVDSNGMETVLWSR